jgi:hypothetical protein
MTRTARLSQALADALEPRLLMHAGEIHDVVNLPVTLNVNDLPAIESTTSTGTGPDTGITTNGPVAISNLQKYHSRPGSTVKLYLDFNGQAAMTWGQYSVPAQTAWSTDGDNATFSDAEQQAIYEIWARVAEKYAPFNIDVTTEDPGNRTAYQTLSVVFCSEDGTSWLGGQSGGVAYINSFRGGTGGNTVFVFPKNLGPYYPKYVAEAAAHESGHAFGLNHQSTWSGGTKTEYNPGNSLVAPIMGNSYSAQRGLWWNGINAVSSTTVQDDLAIISSSSNRFGYAPDDHGNTVSSADPLYVSGTSVSGYGVIEQMTDADAFSFTTGAGNIQVTVDSAKYGSMLDLKLSLYDNSGNLVASADNQTFGENLNVTVNAGTYKLVVGSHGSYGDLGQYAISGTIVAPTTPPPATLTAPTSLAAALAGGQINLAWTDTNSAETGYVVQLSTDGVTFTNYVTLAANATTYTDTGISAGGTYAYRVFAIDATTASGASNAVSVTLAPTGPASLIATATSATQVNLQWSDVGGETAYRIERSTDGFNFTAVTTVNANVTTYSDTGLAASTKYTYRVIATNAGGDSAASPLASATTPAAPVVINTLNAPTNLTAAAQKNGRIKLTWKDTNATESGYRIEYSTDGMNFSLLANVAASTTNYQTNRLTGTYYFRVKAYSSSTESDYSNVAQTTSGSRVAGSAPAGSLLAASGSSTAAPAPQATKIARVFHFLTKLPSRH